MEANFLPTGRTEYRPIARPEDEELEIWGVVTNSIRASWKASWFAIPRLNNLANLVKLVLSDLGGPWYVTVLIPLRQRRYYGTPVPCFYQK